MPPLSLAALTILDAGPIGQVEAAAQAGWPSVGLRLNPLLASDPAIVGHGDREADLRARLAATGHTVLEIGVFPIRPDMDVDALEPIVAFSAEVGARFLVCPVEDPDERRRLDSFGRLAALARRHGLAALIEFNPYSACRNLAAADAMLDALGDDDAGLVIDALHLSRSGGSPADLARVDPRRLRLVHFCDAPAFSPGDRDDETLRRESRTARLYPGEGQLSLNDLIDALPPGCPISVEAPSAADAGKSATQRAINALAATRHFFARRN